MKNLFQSFYQTSDEKAQSLNTNGHGLGLNISFTMARILGGSLTAESEFRKGSTFTLFIKGEEKSEVIKMTPKGPNGETEKGETEKDYKKPKPIKMKRPKIDLNSKLKTIKEEPQLLSKHDSFEALIDDEI